MEYGNDKLMVRLSPKRTREARVKETGNMEEA
jgi:hypothetical protein